MSRTVFDTIAEMRSAVELSRRFGTPVADHQLILDWAKQLEAAPRPVPSALREFHIALNVILRREGAIVTACSGDDCNICRQLAALADPPVAPSARPAQSTGEMGKIVIDVQHGLRSFHVEMPSHDYELLARVQRAIHCELELADPPVAPASPEVEKG